MTIKHVEQKEFIAPKELFEPNIQIEKYTFNTESFEIEAQMFMQTRSTDAYNFSAK